MVDIPCYIDFDSPGDISGLTGTRFYINPEYTINPDGSITPDTTSNYQNGYSWGIATIARSLNKGTIPTKLPVTSYYQGGLSIDLGMVEDMFTFNLYTYSMDAYRYLWALCKCNTGIRSGTMTMGDDTFVISIRNLSANIDAEGQSFRCKIQIQVVLVNSSFSNTTSALWVPRTKHIAEESDV